MTAMRWALVAVIGWLTFITLSHLWLNLGWFREGIGPGNQDPNRFRVGFLPVT